MSIFKKKKEVSTCSCGGNCNTSTKEEKATNSKENIKILGSGCSKCNMLEEATIEALQKLGMDDKVEHITDLVEIVGYGVMTTPALVVDNKVVSYGKVLSTEEVIELIKKARA